MFSRSNITTLLIFEIPYSFRAIERKIQTKEVNFYNLDAIISVVYRVNSRKATQFRIWATGVLKEFMLKGFVLDDEPMMPLTLAQTGRSLSLNRRKRTSPP